MMIKFFILLTTLCAFNQGVFAETLSATDDYVYEVKQGDNLGKLSRDVLDSPARWNEVARYNKLKNPNFIKPSQQLNIPLAWLKNTHAVAHIEFVTGAVLLNGQSARMGDAMSKDAVLETPAGGSVRLSLPDGSTINVLEKSNVAVKQLTKQQRGNFFNSIFRLVSGRIEVFKKKYSLGQAPLHIQGQNATIGVRGTHFRVAQVGSDTLAEIEDGGVVFGAEQSAQLLALSGGQGSVADGIHPPQVIALLAQPKFPTEKTVFSPTTISFTMRELSGATGYRGEVAEDESFNQLVTPVSAEGNVVNIAGLSEGRYWLRLRAVDQHGLQGKEGKVSFTVKWSPSSSHALSFEPSSVVLNPPVFEQGAQITVNWQGEAMRQYELQVASSTDFLLPWITQISQGTQLSVPTPMPGHYYMRVRALNGKTAGEWSNLVDLNVE